MNAHAYDLFYKDALLKNIVYRDKETNKPIRGKACGYSDGGMIVIMKENSGAMFTDLLSNFEFEEGWWCNSCFTINERKENRCSQCIQPRK